MRGSKLALLLGVAVLFACDSVTDPPERNTADVVFGMSQAVAFSATVEHSPGPCGMPGSDADGNFIFGGIGEGRIIVQNANLAMLTCKGNDITNLSGQAQTFRGFDCGILLPDGGFVITNDSRAVVAPNGNASMTCRYRP